MTNRVLHNPKWITNFTRLAFPTDPSPPKWLYNKTLTGISLGLLLFHAPVLKPNLDLSFCQPQRPSQIDAPSPVQVLVGRERLLEVHQLFARVSGPLALLLLPLALHAYRGGLHLIAGVQHRTVLLWHYVLLWVQKRQQRSSVSDVCRKSWMLLYNNYYQLLQY